MGCDIHSVVQVKKQGAWVTVQARPGGDDRDYDSFAVLADVRNGRGFAGYRTGEGWPVITEPRGLPSDFDLDDDGAHPCPPWQYNFQKDKEPAEFEHTVWMGDHSHSHALLSEILDFLERKIPKTYTREGVVDYPTYTQLRSGKLQTPSEWCGGISGPGIVVISAKAADAGKVGTHVSMEWEEPAREALYMLNRAVDEMLKIMAEHKVTSHEVRLVFGFDN